MYVCMYVCHFCEYSNGEFGGQKTKTINLENE